MSTFIIVYREQWIVFFILVSRSFEGGFHCIYVCMQVFAVGARERSGRESFFDVDYIYISRQRLATRMGRRGFFSFRYRLSAPCSHVISHVVCC